MATKTKTTKRRKRMTREKPMMLRTSERSSYKRCQHAWNYAFNRQLKPKQEAPALKFGTLIHGALEVRYPKGARRGPKPAPVFEKLYAEMVKEDWEKFGFKDEGGIWAEALELGVDMLEHFIEVYGQDEEWKVLASEQTFEIPVYHLCLECKGRGKLRKGKRRVKCSSCTGSGESSLINYVYVGTMDGVWQNRMDNRIRIIDWKTTGKDPTLVGHLSLDEQATAYWTWGVDHLVNQGILKPKQKQELAGMLYTFLRKSMRDDRPQNKDGHYLNKDGSVSKVQPSPYFHRELVYRSEVDRVMARNRAANEVAEIKMRRAGDLGIGKAPHFINCNMCAYRDACELHESGADEESLISAAMVEWDPYAAHEIQEEGK